MIKPFALLIIVFQFINTSLSLNDERALMVFQRFESGLKNANVEEFFADLDSEIYLNLGKGVSGYFSSNQSYYLINDFLREYSPISFKIYKREIDTDFPNALGSYFYNRKGIRGNSKVFVALNKTNSGWKISQISFD